MPKHRELCFGDGAIQRTFIEEGKRLLMGRHVQELPSPFVGVRLKLFRREEQLEALVCVPATRLPVLTDSPARSRPAGSARAASQPAAHHHGTSPLLVLVRPVHDLIPSLWSVER
jgi:hypothetical protein